MSLSHLRRRCSISHSLTIPLPVKKPNTTPTISSALKLGFWTLGTTSPRLFEQLLVFCSISGGGGVSGAADLAVAERRSRRGAEGSWRCRGAPRGFCRAVACQSGKGRGPSRRGLWTRPRSRVTRQGATQWREARRRRRRSWLSRIRAQREDERGRGKFGKEHRRRKNKE